MKTKNKLVLVSILLTVLTTLGAKALIQNDVFLFNSGGSSTNGIQIDLSSATNGLTVLNGRKNQSPNGSFGGGLMFIDQTAASSTRKSIVNQSGVLYEMDNGGNLLKILLSTDLASYDPQILQEPLSGFTTSPITFEHLNDFTPILEAFQILDLNRGNFKNGNIALAATRLSGDLNTPNNPNDVILKTDNNKVLQVQLGVGGPTANVLTTADLSPTANKLLEVNGKSLTATNTTASFNVASLSGTAYFAKIANYSPDIIVKRQTATQIQIINGATVTTLNSGNTNVVIPGTNLQVDSFDGTKIVFEKTSSTGLNAKKADIVMHYFGQ